MQAAMVSQNIFRTWLGYPPSRHIFYQICDKFFAFESGKRIIEVGCAPGERILEFSARYNYIPYGVEYTEPGVCSVRTKFKTRGIPAENCIFSNVFDPTFQALYKNSFDSVISLGVIEHFTNVRDAIDAHLNILKPGGKLLIMIPRLRGIYFPLTRLFAPGLIAKHNLSIMKLKFFRALFPESAIAPLFCGHYGVLNFGMLQGESKTQKLFVKFLQLSQVIFNPILRHCHFFENSLTSPYLMYIGIKK